MDGMDSGLAFKSVEGVVEAPAQLILQLGIITREVICVRKGKSIERQKGEPPCISDFLHEKVIGVRGVFF